MLDIHFYGTLRRLSEHSKATDDSILMVEYLRDETMKQLLLRLGIDEEVGDIFINRIIGDTDSVIPEDGSRIAIFSRGMFCIDGAQYLKGHGFIVKKAPDMEWY